MFCLCREVLQNIERIASCWYKSEKAKLNNHRFHDAEAHFKSFGSQAANFPWISEYWDLEHWKTSVENKDVLQLYWARKELIQVQKLLLTKEFISFLFFIPFHAFAFSFNAYFSFICNATDSISNLGFSCVHYC